MLISRGGTERPIAHSGEPIRLDSNAAARGVVLVFRDQTEELRHLDALAESERRFRSVFEQGVVGIAQVSGTTDRFYRINRRYCEILGYNTAELIGRSFALILPAEDVLAHREKLAALIPGRRIELHMEKRHLRKYGAAVWAEVGVSPIWGLGEERDFFIVAAAYKGLLRWSRPPTRSFRPTAFARRSLTPGWNVCRRSSSGTPAEHAMPGKGMARCCR
ncbi:MAG: PAS domain S-box protein [Rhodocyclaceae bacterium]